MEVISQSPYLHRSNDLPFNQPINTNNNNQQNHHNQNNNNQINNNNSIKSKKSNSSSNLTGFYDDNSFDDMYPNNLSSPLMMGGKSPIYSNIVGPNGTIIKKNGTAGSGGMNSWKACCVNARCMLCVNGTPRCLCMNHPSWTLILRVVFFSLSQLYPDKEFFNLKKEVYVYLNDHWEILSPNQKQSHNWRRQVQDALSHSRFFRSGRHTLRCNGYWQLKLQCNPWKYVNSKQFEALKIDEPGSPQDDFINYFPYNVPGDKQVHLQPRTNNSNNNNSLSNSPTPTINSSQTTPTTSPSEIAWIMSSPKSLSLTNLKPISSSSNNNNNNQFNNNNNIYNNLYNNNNNNNINNKMNNSMNGIENSLEYNDLSSPSSNYHSDDMPSSPLSNSSPPIGCSSLNLSQDSTFNFSALATLSNFSLSQQPVQLPNPLKISSNGNNSNNGLNNLNIVISGGALRKDDEKINQMKSILNCTF